LASHEKLTISAWIYDVNSAMMQEWDYQQNKLVSLTGY